MIYRVEIENFFSIAENQVIDLRVRKSVDDRLGRLSQIHEGSEERAPNVVALFGANAAGKSNILRAIAFGAWFGGRSFDARSGDSLPYEKFGSKEKIAQPTRLVFSFSGLVDYMNFEEPGPLCPYTYEIELSPRGERDTVILEKLSIQPRGHGKAKSIFERRSGRKVRFAKGFIKSGTEKAIETVLRPDASVISTLAQLNHGVSEWFVEQLGSVVSNIFIDRVESSNWNMTKWYESSPAALDELQRIARRIDLGIEQIEIGGTVSEPQMLFRHSGLDQQIRLDRESHGTQRFIQVFPYILMALSKGGIAIVDELDTAIHPLILPEILGWFNDQERNPHNAQLWVTCHSASLLSDLTKEEVVFCEKDSGGETSIYSLADIDGVRRDENFSGKYLGGEYGAVPVLG